MARGLSACVGVLAFLGVGASVAFFLKEPYNEGFARFPSVMWLHVIPGGVYLALAPFQLVPGIRRRALGYHRLAGRCLTAIGLVTGATAIFISLVVPCLVLTLMLGPVGLLLYAAIRAAMRRSFTYESSAS
jgi:hypothetical protein